MQERAREVIEGNSQPLQGCLIIIFQVLTGLRHPWAPNMVPLQQEQQKDLIKSSEINVTCPSSQSLYVFDAFSVVYHLLICFFSCFSQFGVLCTVGNVTWLFSSTTFSVQILFSLLFYLCGDLHNLRQNLAIFFNFNLEP